MKSPLADSERDRLIAAMLPDVPFDGWSQHALRVAAERIGVPVAEARALFPRGAIDMVAAFSRWADRQMLDRVEAAPPEPLSLSRRIARTLRVRFELLLPFREAVRRGMPALAMPQNAPLRPHPALAVEVQFGLRVGDRSAPALDAAPDQVLHDCVGVALSGP